MSVVTNYQSSQAGEIIYPCTDEHIEDLIQTAVTRLGCTSKDVINVQLFMPKDAGEWGVRVFCRKE